MAPRPGAGPNKMTLPNDGVGIPGLPDCSINGWVNLNISNTGMFSVPAAGLVFTIGSNPPAPVPTPLPPIPNFPPEPTPGPYPMPDPFPSPVPGPGPEPE